MIKLLFWIGVLYLALQATKWFFALLILFAILALMGRGKSQNNESSLSQSELDLNILNDGLDDWDLDVGDD